MGKYKVGHRVVLVAHGEGGEDEVGVVLEPGERDGWYTILVDEAFLHFDDDGLREAQEHELLPAPDQEA